MVADYVNYRDDIGREPTNDQNYYSIPRRIKSLSWNEYSWIVPDGITSKIPGCKVKN